MDQGDRGKEKGGKGWHRSILPFLQLTWPHPGLPELFVGKVHLVQTTLNLLDAVGGRQGPGVLEDSYGTEERGRQGGDGSGKRGAAAFPQK